MRKTLFTIIVAMLVAFCYPGVASAGPDQYCGDTSLYGGAPTVLQPNILIIVDNSGSMGDSVPGGVYDPAVTYPVTNNCSGNCATNAVYQTGNGGSSGSLLNASITNITTSCNGANPQLLLQTTGLYGGRRLNSDGTCRSRGSATYALGNYINWYHSTTGMRPKMEIAIDVVQQLVTATNGVKFGLMRFRSDSQGGQLLSSSVAGADYITTVKDMDAIHTGTTTNRLALVDVVGTLTASTWTPLGEALFEAMRYLGGGNSAFSNTIGITSAHYTSPIEYGCQKNYVVFVTDGMSTSDGSSALNLINTTYGSYDGGFCTGYGSPLYTTCTVACDYGDGDNTKCRSLPGVAKYMYEHNLLTGATSTVVNNVTTYTIGFGLGGADQQAIDLLRLAADSNHGRAKYFNAGSEAELSAAFLTVVSEIFSVNTSFVAPVVPVSPENRTYSGSRIYMGFFKPESSKFWSGNLKKFALDSGNNILDSLGHYANYVDSDQNGFDDRDNASLGSLSNGSFRLSSQSYWSTTLDTGVVEEGAVGAVLAARVTARNIYTFMGSNDLLTDASNSFTTTNAGITPTLLGFTAGDTAGKDNLITYLQGQDSYDANTNGDTTEKRDWILGDILHSKPQIVSYNTYTYSHETDCSGTFISGTSTDNANNTMIFVGSNDGMLHAFKDCDGSEAWAFIPPDLLPVLQYLGPAGSAHTYFVDFSPSTYILNKDKSGNINSSNGDKVILVFGLRRGGGLDSSPTKGYYYALDVTDPQNPVFLGSVSNTSIKRGTTTTASTAYSELGEAWSDMSFGKIKTTTYGQAAAFIGAGYDNCNEDGRYGPTQTYTGACVSSPTNDIGVTTSTNGAAPLNPQGRGIYVMEIGTFDASGNLSTANIGAKIWGYTNVDNPTGMTFSIPGRLKPLDTNYDNYVDRLYAGDTGGNLWRFNIKDPSPINWTANKIFSSNPGYPLGVLNASDVGRKIFYEPSAFVLEDGSVRLFFGTGDREHPLNRAVVDRMYSLMDRGQTTAKIESNLVDVTSDTLQDAATTAAQAASIISQLTSSTNYGWYIRLDQNAGEKVLAPAILYNAVTVYTTFSPLTTPSADPCVTGNLGTARAYLVNYLTGAAAINFDTTNDATATTNTYARASGADYNLFRSDRVVTLGSGIPSGGVIVISSTGTTSLMIGVGGSFQSLNMSGTSSTLPLYWRQKAEHQ